MNPQTVEEWAEYIKTLKGLELRSKAIAANSIEFVQMLQEELYKPSEISEVLTLFALQFNADDQAPPEMPGQYLSYTDLLRSIGR
jgi:hypothetical protein